MNDYVLLFDIDGVVAQSPHEESWKDAAIEYVLIDKDFNFTEFYQKHVAGIPGIRGAYVILEELGYYRDKGIMSDEEKEKEAIKFREFKQKFVEKGIEDGNVKIFSDIISIIIQAKNNNIPVSAVSSSKNAEKILKKAGVYDLFDCHTLGAEKHRINKKEELYILGFGKVLEKFQFNEIPIPIVFEDADKCIVAAKNNGYLCVGISRPGLSTIESLKEKGADVAYDSALLKEKGFIGIMNDLKGR
ncbi:hypothetical protein GOV12_02960 [Candidatus Pacearchaeota archaeon]|nr:hypothetical protein [Candidatus Pacearchaeota archaeon]